MSQPTTLVEELAVLIAHEALGYEYVGDTNNVDVHIAHLRAKIEDAGGARIIQTVRGVGYVCRA